VRASAAYRLIVRRGGHGPAWAAGSDRTDHVEVVDLDDGEVVLLWEGSPREARRVIRALRHDLAELSAEEFLAAWRTAE
jgi:hypothetical protein